MLVQESKGADAVDRVRADEDFQLAAVADAEPGTVKMKDLGVFVSNGLVARYAVEVTALDHERARSDQGRHFGVVERAAQVELEDLVFVRPDIAVRVPGGGVLPHP